MTNIELANELKRLHELSNGSGALEITALNKLRTTVIDNAPAIIAALLGFENCKLERTRLIAVVEAERQNRFNACEEYQKRIAELEKQ